MGTCEDSDSNKTAAWGWFTFLLIWFLIRQLLLRISYMTLALMTVATS